MWWFRCILIVLPIFSSCGALSNEETEKLTLCDCAKFNLEQGRPPFKPYMSVGFRIKVKTSYPEYMPCDLILREFEKLSFEEQEKEYMELLDCISPEEMMKYAP